MSARVSHLDVNHMSNLSEEGRLSMLNLFRRILHNNPPIKVLNMDYFSMNKDKDTSIGELVLESLLSSNIESITDLNLSFNKSWFKNFDTIEESSSNVDLLC